ncbi:MAG: response regulator transcription factor [Hyphomicrobiaceae bacterium]
MTDSSEATRQTQGRIVYVVEDNLEIGRLVCATLDEHGFRSEHFLTGANFLHGLKRKAPAVSVIDLTLPDLDGLQLIREVQSVSDSAILVLTGRDSVEERILGLELGADDYMVKPFEPREVVARVNTILRRLERKDVTLRTARFGDWTFEESCNRLTAAGGREVELSVAEARLLATMLKRPNRILNRTDLLDAGGREPLDRSIDARISRLRRKLQPEGEEDDKEEKIIKTVYGAGYMLVAKVEWE